MKIRVLGAYGAEGLGQRPTAFLVNERVLVDAGTVGGALTGAEQRLIQHALISHSHLDHVVGLSYLPGVLTDRRIRIHAPAPPLVASGSEALDRLIGPPLFPVPFHRWPMPVEVVPFAGRTVQAGAWTLATRAQKHPGGSVGLRLGDRLAYVTDTVLDLATLAFVRGVDTLLHEVCHHLDYTYLKLGESFHTEGFFKRESSLFYQLVPREPPPPAGEREGPR